MPRRASGKANSQRRKPKPKPCTTDASPASTVSETPDLQVGQLHDPVRSSELDLRSKVMIAILQLVFGGLSWKVISDAAQLSEFVDWEDADVLSRLIRIQCFSCSAFAAIHIGCFFSE